MTKLNNKQISERRHNCPVCGKFMEKVDVYDMENNLHELWICYYCNEDIPRGVKDDQT